MAKLTLEIPDTLFDLFAQRENWDESLGYSKEAHVAAVLIRHVATMAQDYSLREVLAAAKAVANQSLSASMATIEASIAALQEPKLVAQSSSSQIAETTPMEANGT